MINITLTFIVFASVCLLTGLFVIIKWKPKQEVRKILKNSIRYGFKMDGRRYVIIPEFVTRHYCQYAASNSCSIVDNNLPIVLVLQEELERLRKEIETMKREREDCYEIH